MQRRGNEMIRNEWFEKEKFKFVEEPVFRFEDGKIYVNGVEIFVEDSKVKEIESIQTSMNKIIEVINKPETLIVYVPKEFDGGPGFFSPYATKVRVTFDGDKYTGAPITEIAWSDYYEKCMLKFSPQFPIPHALIKALKLSHARSVYFFKREEIHNL